MVTAYGVSREPCTRAVTAPGVISKLITWPLRAYDRPRANRPPSQICSRMSTNRRDHHWEPIRPRLARTAMPPSTSIGLPPWKYRPSGSTGISTHRPDRAAGRGFSGPLGSQREQLTQLGVAEIGDPVLARPDHGRGERLLPLDHRV